MSEPTTVIGQALAGLVIIYPPDEYRTEIGNLRELMDEWGPDEFDVAALVLERIEFGRQRHGQFDVMSRTPAEWEAELDDEVKDLLVYAAARELRIRKADGAA